jgi:copper chaperone
MDVNTREYTVSGMTCGHCEQSVREEVGGVAGVQDVEVSVATGTLTVTLGAPVEDAAILAAVDDAGYSAVRVA